MVSGMTYGLKNGVAISRPSTALRTEMAGVIMPSPYRSAHRTREDINVERTGRGARLCPVPPTHQRQIPPSPAIVESQDVDVVLDHHHDDQ